MIKLLHNKATLRTQNKLKGKKIQNRPKNQSMPKEIKLKK
jgi:hypothetical protein